MIQTIQAARRLADYAEARRYAGFDPYDHLNSPLTGVLSLGTRFGRIALTQLGRRSPVNFRPRLFVRPGVNPKALALFLEGTVKLFRAGGDEKDKSRTRICTAFTYANGDKTLRMAASNGCHFEHLQ